MAERDFGAGQVAYRSELSVAEIYRLLSGDRPRASGVTLAKVAGALDTTTDYLLGLTANPLPPDNPAPTKQESRLLRIFRSLHEDQRGMVLAYSQWLAERFK